MGLHSEALKFHEKTLDVFPHSIEVFYIRNEFFSRCPSSIGRLQPWVEFNGFFIFGKKSTGFNLISTRKLQFRDPRRANFFSCLGEFYSGIAAGPRNAVHPVLLFCACSGLLIVNMRNCTYVDRFGVWTAEREEYTWLMQQTLRPSTVCNLRKHVVRFLLRRRQFDFIIRSYAHAKVKSSMWKRAQSALASRHAFLFSGPITNILM